MFKFNDMKDDLWKIYDANKEWIKFADTKATISKSLLGKLLLKFY